MSLFVIADLHLSSDGSKSMEIFGARWSDYMNKIRRNWTAVVQNEDTVIIPGDISWGLKLEDARDDLLFLDALPGNKLIGKGNHDFWWSTAAKMNEMMEQNKIQTIRFLYNNAYCLENCIVCGTRGWFPDESRQVTVGDVDYAKIVNREVGRLKLSLEAAKKLQEVEREQNGRELPIEVFLHFPPIWCDLSMQEMLDTLSEFGIKQVYFGHIHSAYSAPRSFMHQNINFTLTSSDFLNFYPLKI